MFATTTKICTTDRSSRAHAPAFDAIGAPAYSNGHASHTAVVVVHAFDEARARRSSAIHFQGRSIRQVSRYTLLSGCRLPWPPTCCLYRSTPFVGSDERRVGRLVSAFGSSRIASPAYQEWPIRQKLNRCPPAAFFRLREGALAVRSRNVRSCAFSFVCQLKVRE